MAEKIAPLSDTFKALLGSVGISPDKFNQGLSAKLLAKEVKGRFSTRHNNEEYYNNVSRLETIASVAARVAKKPPKVYIPLGYVMYIRKGTCKNCGAVHICMDAPGLFLMQTDKLGSATRQFTPVTDITFPGLPHWTKEIAAVTPYCLECYTLGVPVPEAAQQVIGPSTPTEGIEQPQAPAEGTQSCQG